MSASIPPPTRPRLIDHPPPGLPVRRPNRPVTSTSDLTTMVASSVLNPPQPVGPALPRPSRPQTGPGPRATLPPALLAGAATEAPPLRHNKPASTANGRGRKKRGPPLPPSGKVAKKPRTARHTPPASFSSVVAAVTAERRLALDKKVASCLLTRSWAGAAATWPQAGRTALRCLCLELLRGSSCALHQDAPGRSWMKKQKGGVPPVGGDGEVLVPMVGADDSAVLFAKYARWRKNVRMPNRFYMQHVRAIMGARQED